MVVAFSAPNAATILLVGPHDDRDPFMDVYSQLYELAGLIDWVLFAVIYTANNTQ